MSRTAKVRKICCIPKSKIFKPEHKNNKSVILSLDEIEALRLVDLEMLDQDQAANRMQVSRATLQRIVYSARKNVADALVNGKSIEIKGGEYTVANNHCDCETSCTNCRFEEKV